MKEAAMFPKFQTDQDVWVKPGTPGFDPGETVTIRAVLPLPLSATPRYVVAKENGKRAHLNEDQLSDRPISGL